MVTDQNVLDVITAENATLTEMQTTQSTLATDAAKIIAELQALPTGTIQDSTLAALQGIQSGLQTSADNLKTTTTNLDAIVNPPATS